MRRNEEGGLEDFADLCVSLKRPPTLFTLRGESSSGFSFSLREAIFRFLLYKLNTLSFCKEEGEEGIWGSGRWRKGVSGPGFDEEVAFEGECFGFEGDLDGEFFGFAGDPVGETVVLKGNPKLVGSMNKTPKN